MSAYLRQQLASLSQEIGNYPGPIARCDEHLTALLEQRAALVQRLQTQVACAPEAVWTNDGGR